MIKIKCTIDATQVKAGLQALGTGAPKASMRAINRTLDGTKTRAIRDIAADLGIKQADLRHVGRGAGALSVYRASEQSLRGSLQGTGARIPLYDFGAKDTQDARRKMGDSVKRLVHFVTHGQGVTYRMQGKMKRLPHAFTARMASGHIGVFQRKGKRALPVRELFGPSLPHVFRKHIESALKAFASEALQNNLRHEIGYLLTFGRR